MSLDEPMSYVKSITRMKDFVELADLHLLSGHVHRLTSTTDNNSATIKIIVPTLKDNRKCSEAHLANC